MGLDLPVAGLTAGQVNEIASALLHTPAFHSMLHDLAEEFLGPLRMTFVTKDEAALIATQTLSGKMVGRVTRDEMSSAIASSMVTLSTRFENQLDTQIAPLTQKTAELTGKLDAFLTLRQDALMDVRQTTTELAKTQTMITENMARLTEQVGQLSDEVWGNSKRPDDQPSLHNLIRQLSNRVDTLDRTKMDMDAMQPVIRWAIVSEEAADETRRLAEAKAAEAALRKERIRQLVAFVVNPRMLTVIGLSGGTATAIIKFLEALFS